jgi:hypothetical protein
MGINSKIAKIPFLLLYIINASLILFNWLRVIFLQKDFSAFAKEQPWDHFLATRFSEIFATSYRSYFIFALPIYLVLLFVFLKIVGKLLNLDKKSNVKGDNHIAVIAILFMAPVTFGVQKLLGPGWRNHLLPGFILIILFSILSWVDEKKIKTTSL